MVEKIQFYADDTRRFYQLFPTRTIPTLKISGVNMHRFAKVDPLTDTLNKIHAAKPLGVVLDTCMGLGYTAMYAAKENGVRQVFTFEKDKNVIAIAKLNIASKSLFNDDKIIRAHGDISIALRSFKNNFFDVIIHDPPTPSMAVDLYTEKFYKQLFRVLKSKGRLWHYMPSPGKLSFKDEAFRNSIKKKLTKAGFKNIVYDVKSPGFVSVKE